MSKRIKNKKRIKLFSIYITICLLVGIILGWISLNYPELNIIKNTGKIITSIILYLIAIIFTFLVHIILHEIGHLIFGLFSGYKFVSFRVGSHILVREDKGFKWKRFNIPGTAGQCLMMPPEIEDGKFPFIIYNFGGVLINLIVGILGLVYFKNLQLPYVNLGIAIFISGIFIFITNGIPMKLGGIPNDGYNTISMIKDRKSREHFHLQLKINGLLTFGQRPRDISLEEYELDKIEDLENPLNTGIKLMEYYGYLDRGDIKKAKGVLDSLVPHLNKLVSIYRHEINIERIYLELVGDINKEFIDNLYTDTLKRYVTQDNFMLNKKRLLMAYELYYNEDKDEALKYFDKLKKMTKDHPIKGEVEMELDLANSMMNFIV